MKITKLSGVKSWKHTIQDMEKLNVSQTILPTAANVYPIAELEKLKKEAQLTTKKVKRLSIMLLIHIPVAIILLILLIVSVILFDTSMMNSTNHFQPNMTYLIMLVVFASLSSINGINIIITLMFRMPSANYWDFRKFLISNRTNINAQSDNLPLTIYLLFNQQEDKKLIFTSSLRIIKYDDEFLSRYMFKRRFSLRIYFEFATYTKNYCNYFINKR